MGYDGGGAMGIWGAEDPLRRRSKFDDEPPSDLKRLGARLASDDEDEEPGRRPSKREMFDDDEEDPRPARLSYIFAMFACFGPRFTMCFRVALATVFDERFLHMFAIPFMIFPTICCLVARFALLYI
jgi:hypothetical protein